MISKYLQNATEKVDGGTQIVIALDLENIAKPHVLKQKLETSAFATDNEIRADWYDVFASLKGMTVELKVTDKISGVIRVDFGISPEALSPHYKNLLLMALSEYGAELPDLNQWSYRVSGNAIVGGGEISLSGMRRIASLVELPSTKYDDLGYETDPSSKQVTSSGSTSASQKSTPAKPEKSPEELQLQATKAYFDGITTLLDDLKKTIDHSRDNHALWFERYARKIDQLPILNVDKDLLDYGTNITVTFRDIAFASRSGGIDGGVRKSQIYGNYSYADGSTTWGRTTSSMNFQIDREQKAVVNKMRYESWNQIETDTAAMRRMLTERYGLEF